MGDDAGGARVLDEALLRLVSRRLERLDLVAQVVCFPATKPESVVAHLDDQYYPARIDQVTLETRASLDGSFHVTDREAWNGESWLCRWDRHGNPHNDRDHFHPPPDARTDEAVDRDYPTDVLDVVAVVLEAVDDRLGDVWDDDRLVD